jgi:hypothetical protein
MTAFVKPCAVARAVGFSIRIADRAERAALPKVAAPTLDTSDFCGPQARQSVRSGLEALDGVDLRCRYSRLMNGCVFTKEAA